MTFNAVKVVVEIRLRRAVLRVNIAVNGVFILAVNFHLTVEAREVEKELARTFVRVLLGLSGKHRCYRCQHIKEKGQFDHDPCQCPATKLLLSYLPSLFFLLSSHLVRKPLRPIGFALLSKTTVRTLLLK